MDYNQNLKMNSEDPAMFLMLIEGEWIFGFLVGLNIEYDQGHIQVLGKESLTSLICWAL